MVSHNPNPSIDYDSSHSSHDEDEALRVPPKQVDKLTTENDKIHDWLLQENYNIETTATFDALKKVIHNDEHGFSLLRGLTYLVHTHVKPLTQVASEVGMTMPISTLEPILPISIPISRIYTYVAPTATTYVQVSNLLSSLHFPSLYVSVSPFHC